MRIACGRLADDRRATRPKFNASVLVWRICFHRILMLACSLNYLQPPPETPSWKTRIAYGRLADDRRAIRPKFNASVLVRRILFSSYTDACMLLELFATTTRNTKLEDVHRLRSARRRSPGYSAQCFGAYLENFFWESSVTLA
jgi:hypothetical protein